MLGFYQVTINEDVWNFYVVEDNDDVIGDPNAPAFVELDQKEAYFRKSMITQNYVRHEIFHIYFSYLYLNSTTGMTIHDLEEIMAEFWADRGEKMMKTAEIVFKELMLIKENASAEDKNTQ